MTLTRDDIKQIFLDRHDYQWQVQGFGMLRTYLDGPGEPRLQIWDQRLATWSNNAVHDHPWSFESTIFAGTIFNQRFTLFSNLHENGCVTQIKPGTRGGQLSERPVHRTNISPLGVEVYGMGETYSQLHREMHLTRYAQSSITLIERTGREAADLANVAWYGEPGDQPPFVNPYEASDELVAAVVGDALKTWWF